MSYKLSFKEYIDESMMLMRGDLSHLQNIPPAFVSKIVNYSHTGIGAKSSIKEFKKNASVDYVDAAIKILDALDNRYSGILIKIEDEWKFYIEQGNSKGKYFVFLEDGTMKSIEDTSKISGTGKFTKGRQGWIKPKLVKFDRKELTKDEIKTSFEDDAKIDIYFIEKDKAVSEN